MGCPHLCNLIIHIHVRVRVHVLLHVKFEFPLFIRWLEILALPCIAFDPQPLSCLGSLMDRALVWRNSDKGSNPTWGSSLFL